MKKLSVFIVLVILILIFLPIEISIRNSGAQGQDFPNGDTPQNPPVQEVKVTKKESHPWCRFGSLTSRTGNAMDKFVTFTVNGEDPTNASMELFGLGVFEIKGISCIRNPKEQICTGYVNGLPYSGDPMFYSGKLSVNADSSLVCTISKALVPPPVHTASSD